MKKKDVINLIKYHMEQNDPAFRSEATQIARDFDQKGDSDLAEYIMGLLSTTNTLVPQSFDEELSYFEKMDHNKEMLLFPDTITHELTGIMNAIMHNMGVNKFLFVGKPGTGKTEAVRHLGRILKREVLMVEFSQVIDSKLGQTQKNITDLFHQMNHFPAPKTLIILFDEIDALALDRTNANDVREMGRATSTLLKGLDHVHDDLVIIATTNLYKYLDQALLRRFDAIVNFDCYSKEDLLKIAEKLSNDYMNKYKIGNRDIRLFRKIVKLALEDHEYMPAELKNRIKTSIAFSDLNDPNDYYRRLYVTLTNKSITDEETLRKQGFTVREIAVLIGSSKSSVARKLQEGENDE